MPSIVKLHLFFIIPFEKYFNLIISRRHLPSLCDSMFVNRNLPACIMRGQGTKYIYLYERPC